MKKCDICGTDELHSHIIKNKKLDKYLCVRHTQQMRRYGYIKKRTTRDPNEYILHDNFAEIVCYDLDGSKKGVLKIDLSDVEICKKHKWCMTFDLRGCTRFKEKIMFIHSLLMGTFNNTSKIYVDHIDRDPSNNRRDNLRLVTNQQNSFNSSLNKNNNSGIIGVYQRKDRNTWGAELMLNRKKVFREYFKKKDDAIFARLKAELKYFGKEFAPQRHLFEKYKIESEVK